jgi:GT2 family glycosyltransferase
MTDILLTIGIKALNEEARIAACLASAVAAAERFGGEVILADSGSTDRTVEIACGFPVRIVQFADISERCCGAGAQLAFQHARGRYFYLLDGDMVLKSDFIAHAIDRFEAASRVAGIGGQMVEMTTDNLEFQMRADRLDIDPDWRPGPVSRLDCGGLYRSDAVREIGYFGDRNLHAFEEFDLAARLRAAGWGIERLAEPAMDHYGHSMAGYRLLWRRFRTGYAGSGGEVLRGAIGQRHLPIVLRLGHVRNSLVVMGWWLVCLAALVTGRAWLLLPLLLTPLLLLRWRQGSWARACYIFAMWNAVAAGSLPGFLRRRRSPRARIDAIDLNPALAPHEAMP